MSQQMTLPFDIKLGDRVRPTWFERDGVVVAIMTGIVNGNSWGATVEMWEGIRSGHGSYTYFRRGNRGGSWEDEDGRPYTGTLYGVRGDHWHKWCKATDLEVLR